MGENISGVSSAVVIQPLGAITYEQAIARIAVLEAQIAEREVPVMGEQDDQIYAEMLEEMKGWRREGDEFISPTGERSRAIPFERLRERFDTRAADKTRIAALEAQLAAREEELDSVCETAKNHRDEVYRLTAQVADTQHGWDMEKLHNAELFEQTYVLTAQVKKARDLAEVVRQHIDLGNYNSAKEQLRGFLTELTPMTDSEEVERQVSELWYSVHGYVGEALCISPGWPTKEQAIETGRMKAGKFLGVISSGWMQRP